MNDKIRNKSFLLKIFSVVMAIVLWIILIVTVNPSTTKTVRNIPVTFSGTQTLIDNGLVLMNNYKTDTVDVKIRGERQSVIKALDTIRATVDLSDITTAGKYNKYTTFETGVSGVFVESRSNSLITVEVDELIKKDIPIVIHYKGNDKGKNIIVETIPEVSFITASGAKSELEKIKEAVIDADAVSSSGNTGKEYPYYFVDENGQKIDALTLINLPEAINVTHNTYEKKTLPIKIDLEKDVTKYRINVKSKEFDEVDVGISDDFSDDIKEIVYKFNPDNFDEEVEEYSLTAEIPEGVYISDSLKTIKVKLELIPLRENN